MLARELQIELNRVGCNAGDVDGVWADKAKIALSEFTRFPKVALPSDEPSSGALQAVRNEKNRICPSANSSMLVRELQTELNRVGCDAGEVNGVWGDKAKTALTKFARFAKVALPSDEPSSGALQAVRNEGGRICASAPEISDDPKPQIVHRPKVRRAYTTARASSASEQPRKSSWGFCRGSTHYTDKGYSCR
jgi:hypothetical protein